MTEQRLQRFGGAWVVVTRTVEPLAATLQRCREADQARIAEGAQDAYLAAQCAPKRPNWQTKYFR